MTSFSLNAIFYQSTHRDSLGEEDLMVIGKIFRIRDLMVRVNRNKRTIVHWERAGKIPIASRNKINERIYDEKDIRVILELMEKDNFYERRPKR